MVILSSTSVRGSLSNVMERGKCLERTSRIIAQRRLLHSLVWTRAFTALEKWYKDHMANGKLETVNAVLSSQLFLIVTQPILRANSCPCDTVLMLSQYSGSYHQ